MQIVPLMSTISSIFLRRPDCKRLAHAVGVDKLDRYELIIPHGTGGNYAQWVSEDGLDGSPDIDYLETSFE